jgi:hypothetical protein
MPERDLGTGSDVIRLIRTTRQKIRKLKEMFRAAWDSTDEWREDAIESYKFVKGDQWSDKDKQKLADEDRPALVINKIISPVMFLAGVQRQQRTEVKLVPFERGDVRGSEIMTGLYKYIAARSREKEVDSRVFLDKIVTGLGFWKLGIDFDQTAEGELRWERVSPLAIFADPNWVENGWSKAQYVMHALWMNLDALMQEYPQHKSEIRQQYGDWLHGDSAYGDSGLTSISGDHSGDAFSSRRHFWDPETQRARVVEAWWVEVLRTKVAVDLRSNRVSSEPEDIEVVKQLLDQFPEAAERVALIERPVRQVKVAKFMNDILLDEFDSPFTGDNAGRFPIFPAVGYRLWGNPIGTVQNMKDPQREKNKRRSSMIEVVRRLPHGVWMNQESEGADPRILEKVATGAGGVVSFRTIEPKLVPPPELPQSLVYLDRMSDQEIRDIPNIHSELTGNSTQRTVSGRAIEARQRGGLTVQEPLLESFESEKQEAAAFMLGLIQQFVTPEQAFRILGSIAVREPSSPEAALLAEQDMLTLEQTLQGAFDARYDVILRTQPYEPSLQMQRWQILLEFAELFGPAIPPEVLAEQARDAGLLTEDHAQKILVQAQALMAAQQQQQQAAARGMEAAASPPQLQ